MENANTSTTRTSGDTSPQASGGLVSNVRQRATAQLDTQKGRATDGLSALSQAARQTTQQLRSTQHETIADYIDRAAQQLDRFTERIRNKDVDELLRDAQQLARRQPALFIGGSFVAGLLAARFLKSSQQDGNTDQTDQYASGSYPTLTREVGGASYATESQTTTARSRRARPADSTAASERF
jgi:hypothetical protein